MRQSLCTSRVFYRKYLLTSLGTHPVRPPHAHPICLCPSRLVINHRKKKQGDDEPPLDWRSSDLVVIDVPNVTPPPEPQYEALHVAIVRRRIAREAQRQQRRQQKREDRRYFDTIHRRSSESYGDFSRSGRGRYNSYSNDVDPGQEVGATNRAGDGPTATATATMKTTRQAVRRPFRAHRAFDAFYRIKSSGTTV